VTKPGSDFALSIFKEATAEPEEDLKPYRMGVALHTLADTWAHQGFSGIEEKVNNVEAIHLKKGNDWKHLFWENIFLDALPRIGHGQAGKFPDMSHLTWKYKHGVTKKEVEHDNSDEFMKAAERIYNLLVEVRPSGLQPIASWADIGPRIKDLITMEVDVEEKCDAWKRTFDDWFSDEAKYDYDKKAWRRDALGSDDVDWDKDKPSDFRKRKYEMQPGFATKPWVMFHRAAEKQRHYVMEQML
jgi:hypothetical protein